MKKYIYIQLCLIFSLLCTSCNDFLDRKPLDKMTEDDVFNDDALLAAYVNACYNAYPTGFEEAMMSSTTDETYTRHGKESSIIVSKGEMTPDNITTFDAGRFSNFNYWEKAYEYLRNINIFFEKIDGANVSKDLKSRLTGEMEFIRAFIYSNLIWRFGGVPIVTHSFALGDNNYSLPRNSYDECVDYIISDLNDAINRLPAKMEGENSGRASADACKALKARVLLYAASPLNNPNNDKSKWEKARDASLEVINLPGYELAKDYRSLFLEDNKEVIFKREYTKANGHRMNLFNSPNGYDGWGGNCPLQNIVDDYEMKLTGKKPAEEGSGYDPKNPYQGRDPRFYASILYNGAMYRGRPVEVFIPKGKDSSQGDIGSWNTSLTGYYLYKFMDEDQSLSETNTQPWIFFRLAEFYLNYAEAEFYLGNEEECRNAINRVRNRESVKMPAVIESGDQLLEKLRNERRIELAFENHRYFDLRRWRIAEVYENIDAKGIEVVKKDDGTFSYNPITVLERKFLPQHYLLPIPRSEIIKSNNSLIQNPYYN
ncbi:MAG: RagB/SusD family nutrient uptake outer membrane protein [Bacteroidales bacterium]|nr:RagB/SusD family nutrient uptake outer membrane protein [Bacteroidales bacterium]